MSKNETNIATLEPVLDTENLPEIDDALAQIAPIVGNLTNMQITALKVIAENVLSENRLTEDEIAAKIGVDRKTLYNYRQKPTFGAALAVIIREIVRGNTDNIIADVWEHGRKDWHSRKFLLEYTGQYVQRSQSQNLNLNLSGSASDMQPRSIQDAVDQLIMSMIDSGFSLEQFCERYRRIRAEGYS
jgi:hypothetical protein